MTDWNILMLGKTFKGLTDQLLEWQTQEFPRHEESRDSWTVYLRPAIVVEIAFNEIQASSRYPGGLALRFARVKGYRPDKRPEEADTIETVRALYAAQVHSAVLIRVVDDQGEKVLAPLKALAADALSSHRLWLAGACQGQLFFPARAWQG